MCTTIGFPYEEGIIFGRTLELGMKLDNRILYIPKDQKDFIRGKGVTFSSKYATIGSSFFDIVSFGDGINDMGLMGSTNFFPKYASYSKEPVKGKENMIGSEAFDYLLTRCKDVDEVREEAKKLVLVEHGDTEEEVSTDAHFFFMDKKGNKIVLEPKDGVLIPYDNPYGVLTNSPEFHWHETNIKNYINLRPENIEEASFNNSVVSKLGEGTGMLGIPGDFTPPSRFIRAAYFVANTSKELDRNAAILQGFRILSQFDIPKGAIIDPKEKLEDETLYTSIMDTKKGVYFIKYYGNINIQPFYLESFKEEKDIKIIRIDKTMDL